MIPAVPYVQTMGLSFTVSTVALAAGLMLNGQCSAAALSGSALMLLPALAGMQAGQWLRQRLSPQRFRLCFMGALALLGAWMVLRAL